MTHGNIRRMFDSALWLYCTISINSAKGWDFLFFEKSQKIWKYLKRSNPVSEKMRWDRGRPNWTKWYSILDFLGIWITVSWAVPRPSLIIGRHEAPKLHRQYIWCQHVICLCHSWDLGFEQASPIVHLLTIERCQRVICLWHSWDLGFEQASKVLAIDMRHTRVLPFLPLDSQVLRQWSLLIQFCMIHVCLQWHKVLP